MKKSRFKPRRNGIAFGKKFKIKRIRSRRRTRALLSLFLCIVIFASAFAFSHAFENGTMKLPSSFDVKQGAASEIGYVIENEP